MAKHRFPLILGLLLFAFTGIACSRNGQAGAPAAPINPVALEIKTSPVFSFVAFGDTRFHDPSDTTTSNPAVGHALVAAVDKEQPSFISIGGDIVYVGESTEDWERLGFRDGDLAPAQDPRLPRAWQS